MHLPNIPYSIELQQETINNYVVLNYSYVMLIIMTLSHIHIAKYSQRELYCHVTIQITVYS